MTAEIIATLSAARFETYLQSAGYDKERACALYLWNAQIGAAFHIPIQAVEVSLRNRVSAALVAEFGPDWWNDRHFKSMIDRERVRNLDIVKARIIKRGIPLETEQIIAGLSFGFWIGMLHQRYNPQIWSKHLRSSFTSLPASENRINLFKMGSQIANFRNRISHHEPLIRSDISLMHSHTIKFLSWLCPQTVAWIKPHCHVPRIVREKP